MKRLFRTSIIAIVSVTKWNEERKKRSNMNKTECNGVNQISNIIRRIYDISKCFIISFSRPILLLLLLFEETSIIFWHRFMSIKVVRHTRISYIGFLLGCGLTHPTSLNFFLHVHILTLAQTWLNLSSS